MEGERKMEGEMNGRGEEVIGRSKGKERATGGAERGRQVLTIFSWASACMIFTSCNRALLLCFFFFIILIATCSCGRWRRKGGAVLPYASRITSQEGTANSKGFCSPVLVAQCRIEEGEWSRSHPLRTCSCRHIDLPPRAHGFQSLRLPTPPLRRWLAMQQRLFPNLCAPCKAGFLHSAEPLLCTRGP